MKLKGYVYLWLVIFGILTYESIALNFSPDASLLKLIQKSGWLREDFDLSPRPGKTISLWLGWIGFGIMLLTNLYILRKRVGFFKSLGSPVNWLNFHIFCGLVGPTFILFHTNFKVGGLVAMSFWSMVISFSSGVVGRYFFVQVTRRKADLEQSLRKLDALIKEYPDLPEGPSIERIRTQVMVLAGVPGKFEKIGDLSSIGHSLIGDIKLKLGSRRILHPLPKPLRQALVQYAVTKRRVFYLQPFKHIMGYWHAFHMPFAVFMYVVAVIHIVTALLFHV